MIFNPIITLYDLLMNIVFLDKTLGDKVIHRSHPKMSVMEDKITRYKNNVENKACQQGCNSRKFHKYPRIFNTKNGCRAWVIPGIAVPPLSKLLNGSTQKFPTCHFSTSTTKVSNFKCGITHYSVIEEIRSLSTHQTNKEEKKEAH